MVRNAMCFLVGMLLVLLWRLVFASTFTPANCPSLKNQGTTQNPLVVVCPNSKIASVCQAQDANYSATAVLTVPGGCVQDTIFVNGF
jgi:hypothetical protein